MSRGLDNRNPGNIRRSRVRYRGEVQPSGDADFKQFESMEWGYRAMFVLLGPEEDPDGYLLFDQDTGGPFSLGGVGELYEDPSAK